MALMSFSTIFKCQFQSLGTASLEGFSKSIFFSKSAVNGARNTKLHREEVAFLRVFFFFPLELKHGKLNPTPPEDLQTDVAFPAHPHLLSRSQPLVAYKEQLIPSKGRKPVSFLHAVITSQRVFKLFVFSIASFNLALASKCKTAKRLLAFHIGYSQTLQGSQATGWSCSGHQHCWAKRSWTKAVQRCSGEGSGRFCQDFRARTPVEGSGRLL